MGNHRRNLKITNIVGFDSKSTENAEKVLREIKGKSLQESLKIIEQNAVRMDSEHNIMCKAIAYHGNGDITKTIELLNSIYGTLSNEQKLFLAEMYVLQDLKDEAKKIFEEVYSEDRWEKGLFELGLNIYKKSEERYHDILIEGLRYQPENAFLIEKYANYLVDQGNHKEAASWFRKIDKPYFELIARINDLLAEQQTDIKIVTSVVKYISDRIGVMYLGNIVELAESQEMFDHPTHPYTEVLLSAIPTTDVDSNREMIPLEGDIPSPVHPPKGCKFHTRCKYCTEICKHITPELVEMRPGHFVACHNPLGVEKDS